MVDRLTKEFQVQLVTTLDSTLRRAMFEIMKAFENSVQDHLMEVVQRGEEIAQLKLKLQRVEIKLRESQLATDKSEYGGDKGTKMDKTQLIEPQTDQEDVPNDSGQTPVNSEIDFEVPDDWCAPLGSEAVPKQEDSICPSIKLRKLYIPMSHIPVKKEGECLPSAYDLTKKCGRRTRRGSSLQETPSPVGGGQRRKLTRDMKTLLQNLKGEYIDLTSSTRGLRSGRETQTGKQQENKPGKREKGEIAATESNLSERETMEVYTQTHTCGICKRQFASIFGLSVHARKHRQCQGCKRVFTFLKDVRAHKLHCSVLNRVPLKKAVAPATPQSCNDEVAPCRKRGITKKESTPLSPNKQKVVNNKNNTPSSPGKQKVIKKKGNSPLSAGKKRVIEKDNTASSASKKHMTNEKERSSSPPSEKPVMLKTDYTPLSLSKKQVVIKVEKLSLSSSHINPSLLNPTKGVSCPFCSKTFMCRAKMKAHARVHTGEKPFSCSVCPKKFRIKQLLKNHMMRIHKDQVNSSKTDASVTQPSEDTADNIGDSISPSKDTSSPINHSSVQGQSNLDREPDEEWKEMGTEGPDGFTCLLCPEVSKTKYLLIDHFRSHSEENPLQCHLCAKTFKFQGWLDSHVKRCADFVFQCEKCERRFLSQSQCQRHVLKVHTDIIKPE